MFDSVLFAFRWVLNVFWCFLVVYCCVLDVFGCVLLRFGFAERVDLAICDQTQRCVFVFGLVFLLRTGRVLSSVLTRLVFGCH